MSMHFRFELDILKCKFYNAKWEVGVYQCVFSVTNSFDTQRKISLSFISYYIMLADYAMHFLKQNCFST